MLTGNIRPCFNRRPDKPSTALHHQLANRDHWHHKEIGVNRGPAIIALGLTPEATTVQREHRRFPTDRGQRPKTCEGCAGRPGHLPEASGSMHPVRADPGDHSSGRTGGECPAVVQCSLGWTPDWRGLTTGLSVAGWLLLGRLDLGSRSRGFRLAAQGDRECNSLTTVRTPRSSWSSHGPPLAA